MGKASTSMQVKIGRDWIPDTEELLEDAREFAAVLRRAPFRNREGLRGVSAFAFYWFLRRLRPTIVFEVGVWRGFSTWLIEQAVPQAEIHCYDPLVIMEHYLNRWRVGPLYRSERAHYSSHDFSCAPIKEVAAGHSRPLAFFDDHQNKLPRLLQCRAAGIRDIIFDDNMAGAPTHRSLEDDRLDPDTAPILEREIESYEVFPALWPVSLHLDWMHIEEKGLGLPVEKALRPLYEDRQWHSYVTFVRLRENAL
jgi:hypothetical protein